VVTIFSQPFSQQSLFSKLAKLQAVLVKAGFQARRRKKMTEVVIREIVDRNDKPTLSDWGCLPTVSIFIVGTLLIIAIALCLV